MMIWNVYDYDVNRGEIRVWNIFEHCSFNKDVEALLKEDLTYENFSERLCREVQYYFWSKAEYEVVITSWAPYITNEEIIRLNAELEQRRCVHDVNLKVSKKIDVYDQLMLNWEQFTKYVYSFKKIERGKDI